METNHYELWTRCRTFVAEVCADRDASHGLAHMEKVTENALLLLHMQHGTAVNLTVLIPRVILVAMLHDVADHKYDSTNVLQQRVRQFVGEEATALLSSSSSTTTTTTTTSTSVMTAEEVQQYTLTAIEAISFSKEKSRGRRWFEDLLPAEWLIVRDVVSDADKLEAIGADGLRRCLLYTKHAMLEKERQMAKEDSMLLKQEQEEKEKCCLQNVKTHFEEKLALLSTEYIVTTAGKFLATPKHMEMVKELQEWELHGLPSLT
ncbi:HD superfamily hydrolase [Trypanosoma theileri]|uniref:HD superfamily hydrolase n=1 Tax=Trypanosoma theileri TaxID=67003 RepID=A0A1X0P0R2_9TRYP|nr:HD superfamily hydrolase [Trypanosoma theileri]ORC90495.1 HD superfamily hydrolase [Trypanosoma theileri]